MRRIRCCEKYGFKKGFSKRCSAGGEYGVFTRGLELLLKGGLTRKGWRKKGGYDPQRNQALFWPWYAVLVLLAFRPAWVFFRFFRLYKCYKIAQSITYNLSTC